MEFDTFVFMWLLVHVPIIQFRSIGMKLSQNSIQIKYYRDMLINIQGFAPDQDQPVAAHTGLGTPIFADW